MEDLAVRVVHRNPFSPHRVNGETAGQRIVRLKGEGRWGAYKDCREAYVEDGLLGEELELKLGEEFGPGTLPEGGGPVVSEPLSVLVAEASTGVLPPLPVSEEELDPGGSVVGACPTRADYEWVYANIENGGARASNAPSRGAWGLLKRARKAGRIYESILDKLTPKTLVSEEDVKGDDRARDLTGIADAVRNGFRQAVVELAGRSEDGS